ncbi:MAG: hypothetical protein AAGG50_10420 [Bacteroidota bacterium]
MADKTIDGRHKAIVPPHVWGDGDPEGVRQRAAAEVITTAEAAKSLGLEVVTGFTGSPIWHLFYSWPPNLPEDIEAGFQEVAERWTPILDRFQDLGSASASRWRSTRARSLSTGRVGRVPSPR